MIWFSEINTGHGLLVAFIKIGYYTFDINELFHSNKRAKPVKTGVVTKTQIEISSNTLERQWIRIY